MVGRESPFRIASDMQYAVDGGTENLSLELKRKSVPVFPRYSEFWLHSVSNQEISQCSTLIPDQLKKRYVGGGLCRIVRK